MTLTAGKITFAKCSSIVHELITFKNIKVFFSLFYPILKKNMYIYIYVVPELQMSITADNGVNAFVTFKLLTKPLHIQIWNEFS